MNLLDAQEEVQHNNTKFDIKFRVSIANEYEYCAGTLSQIIHAMNRGDIGDKKYVQLFCFVRDMVKQMSDDKMNDLIRRHKNSWIVKEEK